jgi:alpha-tubulin suppressor-like RCC1 family protein
MADLLRDRLEASLDATDTLAPELGGGTRPGEFVARQEPVGRDVRRERSGGLRAPRRRRSVTRAGALRIAHLVAGVLLALLAGCDASLGSGPDGRGLPFCPDPAMCPDLRAPVQTVPARVAGTVAFAAISAGVDHTCAIATAGDAYCWGTLGGSESTTGVQRIPARVPGQPGGFTGVSAGSDFTCGVSGGRALCWGRVPAADGTRVLWSASPVPLPGALAARTVVAGGVGTGSGYHGCLLTPTGAAHCWGDNQFGQLGAGASASEQRATLTPVAGGLSFTTLAAGEAFTCGLVGDGAAWCWGRRSGPSPQPEGGALRFSALAAGGERACALARDGRAFCSGPGGSSAFSSDPGLAPVPTELRFTHVAVGPTHACALTAQGAAYCWGSNALGALGTGTRDDSVVPVAVLGGHAFTAVSVGRDHTCALNAAGAAYCWGNPGSGALGIGP